MSYSRNKIVTITGTLLLAMAGLGIRFFFSSSFPLVNDEQSFIYDSKLFQPTSTLFWKSPTLITLQYIWFSFVPFTQIVQARLLTIITTIPAVLLLAWVTQRISRSKATYWGTLVVGFLFPSVVAHTSLVLSEQFLLLPLAALIAFTLYARDTFRISVWSLLGLSALVSIATLTRWSAIFWLITIVGLLYVPQRQEFARRVFWLLMPYVIALTSFLFLFSDVVKNFRIAEEFLRFFESSAVKGWFTKFNQWRQPLAQLLPLWISGLFAGNVYRLPSGIFRVVTFIIISFAFFSPEFPNGSLPNYYGLSSLPIILVFLAYILTINVGYSLKGQTIRNVVLFLLPPFLIYAIFDKVNAKYLSEFLPGAIILAGLGIGSLFQSLRKQKTCWQAAAALIILSVWIWPWFAYVRERPYAGTLEIDAVQAATQYLQDTTDPTATVVTGAVVIPLMAQRSMPFEISHPAWRAPTFRGRLDPQFEATFGPVASKLATKEIDVFIDEKLTTDSYRKHPYLNESLMKNYEIVQSISNGNSQPIDIWRPKPQ